MISGLKVWDSNGNRISVLNGKFCKIVGYKDIPFNSENAFIDYPARQTINGKEVLLDRVFMPVFMESESTEGVLRYPYIEQTDKGAKVRYMKERFRYTWNSIALPLRIYYGYI